MYTHERSPVLLVWGLPNAQAHLNYIPTLRYALPIYNVYPYTFGNPTAPDYASNFDTDQAPYQSPIRVSYRIFFLGGGGHSYVQKTYASVHAPARVL